MTSGRRGRSRDALFMLIEGGDRYRQRGAEERTTVSKKAINEDVENKKKFVLCLFIMP